MGTNHLKLIRNDRPATNEERLDEYRQKMLDDTEDEFRVTPMDIVREIVALAATVVLSIGLFLAVRWLVTGEFM